MNYSGVSLGPFGVVVIARVLGYVLDWALMLILYFNTFATWDTVDGSFHIGNAIGLGKWRLEKREFQLQCLRLLANMNQGTKYGSTSVSSPSRSVKSPKPGFPSCGGLERPGSNAVRVPLAPPLRTVLLLPIDKKKKKCECGHDFGIWADRIGARRHCCACGGVFCHACTSNRWRFNDIVWADEQEGETVPGAVLEDLFADKTISTYWLGL
eukprot:gene57509-biopygen89049